MSTTACLAKEVLYGLNLIGGWLPVSILILIVLFSPKSVLFSAEINILFYYILNCFSMINRNNYFLFQVIKRTLLEGSL